MLSVVDRTSLCGACLYSICLVETFKPAVYHGKIKKKKSRLAENTLRLHFKDQPVNTS